MKTKFTSLKRLSLLLAAVCGLVILSAPTVVSAANPTPAPTTNCFGTATKDNKCVATCPTSQPDCNKDPVLTPCKNNTDKKTLGDCLANNNLVTKYVNPFIKLLSVMVGLAVVIGVIVGAIQYSASGGDPQKAANGKKHIRNALLGLIAYLLLFAMLQFLVPGGILGGS